MLRSYRQPVSVLFAAMLSLGATAQAPPDAGSGSNAVASDDRAAVERAVLDYCEAFLENKPEYLERSVDRELTKFGYMFRPDGTPQKFTMTFDKAIALSKTYKRRLPDGPKEVRVIDVREQIACASLTAEWGVDFMNLHKVEGKWKVAQVVWQSSTPRRANSQGDSPAPAITAAKPPPAATPGVPSFESSKRPAAPSAPAPPLNTDEQKRYDAAAAALLKAMNADDKDAYRALHTDKGWEKSIDWWQNLFANQRAKFGPIVRAYPCARGLIRLGSMGYRADDIPNGASFVALFEEKVGGVFTFELNGDGNITATSVYIKEEIAAYDPGDSKPIYSR